MKVIGVDVTRTRQLSKGSEVVDKSFHACPVVI